MGATALKPGPRKSQQTRAAEQYLAGLLNTDDWNHGVWTLEELREAMKQAGHKLSYTYTYRTVERLGYTRKWVKS